MDALHFNSNSSGMSVRFTALLLIIIEDVELDLLMTETVGVSDDEEDSK